MKAKLASLVMIVILFGVTHLTFASTSGHPLTNVQFTQEDNSLKRGAMIYYKMCRVCHTMKYIRYQSLLEIGFNKAQVDALREKKPINQILTKTMSDGALTLLYGQIPPDLSIMAKARKHGPQYIYTLMSSYNEKDGAYDNALFPGIKMPDIMNISTAINDEEKNHITSQIHDVTEFLLWASDPRAAERKTTGYFVIAYFILLSILLYLIMKRVWSRLDKT